MTPEELSELILSEITQAAAAGQIQLAADDMPQQVKVERPRSREHGDWATNVAMQLAKKAHTNPRDLAAVIAARIEVHSAISAVDIAGPGFINVRLHAAAAGELAQTIVEAGQVYGRAAAVTAAVAKDGSGVDANSSDAAFELASASASAAASTAAAGAVNLEYVSANPTGPIHIGGARWAAVGDSLARILEAAGVRVTREYYFNDHGAQIDHFSQSLLARALGEPTPENGYGGEYIGDIAQRVMAAHPDVDVAALPREQAQEFFRKYGVDLMFGEIKEELHNFRSDFDVFFHEDSLHESGAVTAAIEKLRELGVIYEQEGATWLRSSDFGDDKDRVIVKSDGEAAYFAGDIAYYLDKRARGAQHAIYLLGADHHGYIGRMYAMAKAFGDTAGKGGNMEILIGQLVNLVRDGQPVRMSKRAGTVITLGDLVDAAGVDAARYSLVRAAMDTPLEIDLNLISSRTNENPVYYVQYAYARTCSVDRNAAEHGVVRSAAGSTFDPALLNSEADGELLAVLARYPEIVGQAAELREPHRVARYLEELAGAYHGWYGKSRVTPRADEPVEPVHEARLWLNDAAGQVIANGLGLLGVSAPERM
ncbi:MAG: arginine--tRNA ligase [Actinomycetaceae bacterium]|nr:arginine--tRNA ligase [Actinomycetaceae bacterium]MDY5854121.1 arginine--tRNA ligase [Arcanobacterium sp.]